MKKPPNPPLPDDIEALKKLILEKDEQLQNKQSRIEILEELVILFKSQQFGKSSEKSPSQTELFDEVEVEANDEASVVAESVSEEEGNDESSSAPKSGRKPLPATLPRVRVEHDVAEHLKVCECGCQKTEIGEDISEQLDIIPAVVQVIQNVRKKYACKECETGVVTAELPKQPIPKSNASPGLLAHIAVAKYQDALPLYRMETIFNRLGVHLPRNTQARWMIQCSQLLQPLYNLMNDRLMSSGYVHMDETTVQVLNEPDKPPESKSYMWVRRTGDPDRPVILFDYASSRKGSEAEQLLSDYQGYLQTDDYAGYHKTAKADGIVHLGCFAHARRKFIEAQKTSPGENGKQTKADMAINMIKVLYAIEKSIKDKPADERYRIRQEKSVPQLKKIRTWLDKSIAQTLPKGKTGQALSYLDKNWEKLTVYTEDGRLNIDNNPVENAIRPFAIGRKNWMFSNSQQGAKASAMMYSIIETAKANKLEPYAYIRTLFTRLPGCESLESFEKLLPWNVELEAVPEPTVQN